MMFSKNYCILLLRLYILVSTRGANSETFEACSFGYISVRTVELARNIGSLGVEVSSEKGHVCACVYLVSEM